MGTKRKLGDIESVASSSKIETASSSSEIAANSSEITEADVALYDRQIRLWGITAQKRLQMANILVIGFNGVAVEAIKNLVLTGVKSISILDETEVTNLDTVVNFFLAASYQPGQKRAEASASAIKELNPNVKIHILSGDVLSKDKDFFQGFDALVASDAPIDVLIKLNGLCRDHNIKFYCADTWGFYGYFFLDLQKHVYEVNTEETSKETGKKETKTIVKALEYCPLGVTVKSRIGADKKKKQVHNIFVLVQVLNAFRKKYNRRPMPDKRQHDFELLKEISMIVCEELSYDASNITDKMLNSVFAEISPICAVVGGVLTNEIIKGITQAKLPVHNYFLFDGLGSEGYSENVLY